ncbi:hypothetical protein [Nocardioides convexus]|uniref:hypothetical protein n=1 Tax=Nocardioides convexus TaxID=2712224 RepID=UPI0024183D3E|nr:hypothetical protein [Nocardioides convexus]
MARRPLRRRRDRDPGRGVQRAARHRRPRRPGRAASCPPHAASAARPSLASVLDIPVRGASYTRQRAVAERTGGDLVAVVDSVVTESAGGPGVLSSILPTGAPTTRSAGGG